MKVVPGVEHVEPPYCNKAGQEEIARLRASVVELRSALREICDSAAMGTVSDCRTVAEEALRNSARKSK